jgi:hypothetical protein
MSIGTAKFFCTGFVFVRLAHSVILTPSQASVKNLKPAQSSSMMPATIIPLLYVFARDTTTQQSVIGRFLPPPKPSLRDLLDGLSLS